MQLDNENQINQSDICAWSTMSARVLRTSARIVVWWASVH